MTGKCAECSSNMRLQPKLAIGASNDPLEQEADRVADQVMRMPATTASQQTAGSRKNNSNALIDAVPIAVPSAPVVQQTNISRQPSLAPIVRRQWSDAPARGATSAETTAPSAGWNQAETTIAGVRRIPVEGIAGGSTSKDPQSAAREAADNRTIALLPASLDTMQRVDVVLHLHGHNVGYRQRATKGTDDETLGVGTVRDIESDRIEQQITASKRPIIGILPQGTASSGFGNLNADAYIAEVFKKLTAVGAWGPQAAAPMIGRVILSGHSGGGGRISEMMAEPGTPRLSSALKEVTLFDAINGPGELGIVTNWVLQHLGTELAALMYLGMGSGIETPAQTTYLQKSIRFRAYYTNGSYQERHLKLQKTIDNWFGKNVAPALGAGSTIYTQLYANYRTIPVNHGAHNKIMGKDNQLLDALTTLPEASPVTQSVQPKADPGFNPSASAPQSVVETLHAPGAALDPASRNFMETRFGYDFSGVRIHADADAARSASAIHARAYTWLNHVVFAPGAYDPHSSAGARLLAHELTHVVQQVSPRVAPSETLQRQATSQATDETATPIRADESNKILTTSNFGQFSIFVPENVLLGSRKEITNVKVHVFFAAGGVKGADTNDMFLHGLRGASNQSDWITIGVPGISGSANSISDSQIVDCLRSIGINSAPVAVRLTGHSRGCDSLVNTVTRGLIHTAIDRATMLDEAVEHVSTTAVLADGTPDPKRGEVRLNRVQQLVAKGISPGIITAYESTNKSKNLVTGKSAKVAGATYRDLNPECMAAIGAARLVQDAIAIRTDAARDAVAIPAIAIQLLDLNLPPRGTFTTGPSTGGKINFNDFCFEPASPSQAPSEPRKMKDSIKAIRRDPVLVRFINSHNLARYSTVPDWTPFLAHEFFVAEIAHELTE
ncbi:MAG: hypothetical protein DCF24_07740 [Cyanobium sp.]|nr:MAG: hypothetical protein DCF24_07740 [Cyanobium sp.]